MLELLLVLLILLWAFGFFLVPATGSAVHILLVVFLVLLIVRLLQGRGTPIV